MYYTVTSSAYKHSHITEIRIYWKRLWTRLDLSIIAIKILLSLLRDSYIRDSSQFPFFLLTTNFISVHTHASLKTETNESTSLKTFYLFLSNIYNSSLSVRKCHRCFSQQTSLACSWLRTIYNVTIFAYTLGSKCLNTAQPTNHEGLKKCELVSESMLWWICCRLKRCHFRYHILIFWWTIDSIDLFRHNVLIGALLFSNLHHQRNSSTYRVLQLCNMYMFIVVAITFTTPFETTHVPVLPRELFVSLHLVPWDAISGLVLLWRYLRQR